MPLSKQEWEVHVLGYDIKLCNMRGYCREKGISYQGFLYWYKRLADNSDQVKLDNPCFLPVRLKNQTLKTASKGQLRLELKDIAIVVSSDEFSQDLLRQTLSVIRSC